MAKRAAFTVYYDDESGELVDVKYSSGFQAEGLVMHADILKDAVFETTRIYAETVIALTPAQFREWDSSVMVDPIGQLVFADPDADVH